MEDREGFGYIEKWGQVISNVKYAYDLVLQAKEESELWGVFDRLIEIGKLYGLEINVE